ncbi:hypothetical protein EMIT0P228_20711 [Pseudomonas brassicacearum]
MTHCGSELARDSGESVAAGLDVPAQSRASSLPQGSEMNTNTAYTRDPLWERACSRWRYQANTIPSPPT